jgi:hypothetical protein
LELLLTFLLQSDKMESIHPSSFIDALSDWVPRLMKGIEGATHITIQHKQRAASPVLEPSTSLSTPSSSLMALMYDAMWTETATTLVSSTPPRYKVRLIDNHTYNDVTGRLEYRVNWEGEDAVPTTEPYSHLHHLDALGNNERTLQPLKGNQSRGRGRAMARTWSAYYLQKNLELAEIISEDDTDSDTSETAAVPDLDIDCFFNDSPIIPLLDSPASTSTGLWGGELELGLDVGLSATTLKWPSWR